MDHAHPLWQDTAATSEAITRLLAAAAAAEAAAATTTTTIATATSTSSSVAEGYRPPNTTFSLNKVCVSSNLHNPVGSICGNMSCGSSDSWHCQDPSINLNPFDAPDPAEIKIVFSSEHRPHERCDSSCNAYHGLQEVFFALQVVLGMPRGTKTYWHDEHAKLFMSRRVGARLPRQSYPRDNQMLEVIHKIFDAHGVIVSGPGGFGVGGAVAACKDCAEVGATREILDLSFDASVQLFRAAACAFGAGLRQPCV